MSYLLDEETGQNIKKPLLFDDKTQQIIDQFEMQFDQLRNIIRDLTN